MNQYTQTARNKFAKLARERLDKLNLSKKATLPLPTSVRDLYDGRLREQYEYPTYFDKYVNTLSEALDKDVKAVFAAPPQSGKSTTTFAVLMFLCETTRLYNGAQLNNVYLTYNEDFSMIQRDKYVNMCQAAGFDVKTSKGVVYHENGSKVYFTSIGGKLTGMAVNGLIIIDDVFKSFEEALSSTNRNSVWNNFVGNVQTRFSGHLSIVVIATRWHQDDLSGRLIKHGWEYYNYHAYEGELKEESILCKRSHTVVSLSDQIRCMGTKMFNCVYMGEPFSSDELIMVEPKRIDTNTLNLNEGIAVYGFDGSYSGKGDWCVLTRLRVFPHVVLYEKTWRKQGDIVNFYKTVVVPEVSKLQGKIYWHVGGQESTIGEIFNSQHKDIKLICTPAISVGNKTVRAHKYKLPADWESGKIVVPLNVDNVALHGDLKQSLSVVLDFSGDPTKKDDDFDSLVSAYSGVPSVQRIRPEHVTEIVGHRRELMGVGMFKNTSMDRLNNIRRR